MLYVIEEAEYEESLLRRELEKGKTNPKSSKSFREVQFSTKMFKKISEDLAQEEKGGDNKKHN